VIKFILPVAFKKREEEKEKVLQITSFLRRSNIIIKNIFQGKMTLPKFDGEDDREGTRWINKVKNYFDYYNILDEEEKISNCINALG
jgi:hypothetical protein